MEMKFEIKSADGRLLKVYDDRIVLSQKGVLGFMSRGLSGDKTIYYCDITSIQFKEAGWTAGYMEFTFPGSNDRVGGPISGAANENRFTFGKPTIGAARKLNEEMLLAKKFIGTKIEESKSSKNISNNNLGISKSEELLNLKNLLDSGTITSEEFDRLKADIMNK